MSRYAEGTSVSTEKSRGEIERTLERYGADQFMYGWKNGGAVIGFRMRNRVIRMILPLPDKESPEFMTTPAGRRRRTSEHALAAWEQACRQSWRALALVIKAKLEAVAAGISTFEREFLADTVLPSGESVGDWLEPQLVQQEMPTSLPLQLTAGSHD